ncbi:MAG: DUF5610 domain-containing protein [Pseudomonas sp.]
MHTLASLSPAHARPSLPNQSPNARSAADAQRIAQNALANRLAERLGLEPGALNGTREDFTPEKVAGRVLGFIEGHLRSKAAEGADSAELQSLLAQAREGVEKGFAEARKILDGMGVLSGQVAADIDDSYQRIQDGLGELDGRLAAPTAPAPAAAGTAALAAYSERFAAQAETFDMSVVTRDGDRLRISIAQASASWAQTSVAAASDGSSSALSASGQSGSLQIGAWRVEVEGELDEGERAALEKLFNQVQDLSGKFYSGDLAGAFDRAMALELDGEQLASMSLQLTQTRVRQATDAYGAIAEQGGQAASAVNGSLLDYAQGLLEALRSAELVGEDGKGLLEELLKGGFSLDERFDKPRLDKAEKLNSRLLEGLQGLLAAGAETPAETPAAAD